MTTFNDYSPENADEKRKEILDGLQKSYGFIPSLFSYMVEAPTTIEAYLFLNDLLTKTSLPKERLHVALLAASVENDCEFCTVAHRAIGKQSGTNQQSLDALNEGKEIEDPQDRALANFTRSIVKHRGWVPEEEMTAFLEAGFTKQNVFEVILVVTIKTLSNYSNHLTKPEPNPELIAML